MSPEIHKRVRTLFDEAMEWPEAERVSRLQSVCPAEPEVLEAVVRLLNAHRRCDSFLEDEAPPIQRIGRYLVIGELGRGSMGVVYEALDPVIGRKVAVKIIRLQPLTDKGEAQFLRERLFREARSAGVMSHPGIVTVFDVGQEGELAFIAMERVEGVSLDRMLASGRRFSSAEALHILRQVAGALDYAHWYGVVHRDIKPANIMIDQWLNAKIADFGVAKIASSDRHTLSGMVIGTPIYMSPEQIEARASDGRSDQFSLAVLAYEMFTGGRPFQADNLASLAHMIVYSERPSAHAANPSLQPAMDMVFRRGLARLPNDRFLSCSELVAALDESAKNVARLKPSVEAPAPRPSLTRLAAGGVEDRPAGSLRNLLAAGLAVAGLAAFLLFIAMSPGTQPQGPVGKESAASAAPPAAVHRRASPDSPSTRKDRKPGPKPAAGFADKSLDQPAPAARVEGVSPAPTLFAGTFESAAIKPSGPDQGRSLVHTDENGEIRFESTPLRQLIEWAYGVFDFQVLVQDWTNNQRFDIVARFPPGTQNLEVRFMLRKLLEKRFKLAVHRDSTHMSGYALVIAEGGFRLKPAGSGAGSLATLADKIQGRRSSIQQLADALSSTLGRKVTNKTGVSGLYDFLVTWPAQDRNPQSIGVPAMFSSLQKSLGKEIGLTLQTEEVPAVEIVVVDHVERLPADH